MSSSSDARLKKAAAEFLGTFESLPADSLQASPGADSWNRQQVVEHMLLAYTRTAEELERRLAKGKPTLRARTFKERVVQFMLIRCGYFPSGRKAPDMVNPALTESQPRDGAALAAEYRSLLAAMEAAIAKAEAAWGSKIAVATHFRLGPLSAPQWRGFHAVHTRHHTKQMQRIAKGSV